jgi:hypothetical protein
LFPLFATGVIYTGSKCSAGVIDTINNTSETLAKFATSVNNIGSKFATGAVDTGGAP